MGKGNSVQGEIPESGAIFMSNIKTHKECLKRKLLGLPPGMSNFVRHVKEGMTLFLFEFERRLLYGVFRATCDGEINIDPKAFRSSGKHFPAQVRFTTVWECSPLAESEFKDVIRDNYFSGKKFHFGLNEKQVRKLMKLFRSKSISKNYPERSIRRYDKPAEENARSGDLRKDIRHRIRSDSCDFRGDEVNEVDDSMYINKHITEARLKDKREGFLTHYTTERDEFGDYSRHDILGKHLDLREKDIEDGYMQVFSKSHGTHLDEVGVGSSDILMDGVNKDIIDYNRLKDEYNVRESIRRSLNEHILTDHGFSHFNQNDYSNCDPTRIDVPDIQLSSSCFDEGSSFIPIANDCPFYPSPEKIPLSKSLPYYSHDEGSNRYLDDPGLQRDIFPKFISRNRSSDAGLRVHDVDPTDNDFRFCEKHESKYNFGTTDKRASVFSRLTDLRREEQAFETDEKHELSSSVDEVMKMLEKVVSSPKKSRKSISVFKQDDADNSPDSKIEDHEFPDVNLEVDADMAHEEVEGSVYHETRLVDFKRRKKSNKIIDDTSKGNSEFSVGAISDVRPVANDQVMSMSCKRRKLVRPAFTQKDLIPDSVSAHEVTLTANDSEDVVLESSKKVDAFIKSKVPTCHRNTPVDSNSTKAVIGSSKKVRPAFAEKNFIPNSVSAHEATTLPANDSTDVVHESSKKVAAFIKSMVVPTCHENTPDDSNSAKAGTESSKKVRPAYTEKNFIPDSVGARESIPDDSNSAKAEIESSKKVRPAFAENNFIPDSSSARENTPEDGNSTKERIESSKKVGPAFAKTNFIPDSVSAHESTVFANDSADVVLESSEKVDVSIKSMVPTCHENTPDDSTSTEVGAESSMKVDVSIKPIDLNMLPTSDESSSSKDDDNSTKVVLESKKSGNEGDGNAESRLVSDVFAEGTSLKDDQKMCGWIDW